MKNHLLFNKHAPDLFSKIYKHYKNKTKSIKIHTKQIHKLTNNKQQ